MGNTDIFEENLTKNEDNQTKKNNINPEDLLNLRIEGQEEEDDDESEIRRLLEEEISDDELQKNQDAAVKMEGNNRGTIKRNHHTTKLVPGLLAESKISTTKEQIKASFMGSRQSPFVLLDAEIEQLTEKIEETDAEREDILLEHRLLLRQVAKAMRQMGENVDLGVELDPGWGSGIDSQMELYNRKLDDFVKINEEVLSHEKECSNKLMRLNEKFGNELEVAMEVRDKFKLFRRTILNKAINTRTGKPIHKRWILQMEQEEADLDDELERTRLNNIRLLSKLKRLENAIKEKEKLGDGLHLIDFEQLKIENQTLGEKTEERNG